MRSRNWHKSFPYGCPSKWFGRVQLPPLRVPGCFPRQGGWRGWKGGEVTLPLGKEPAMEELCSLGQRGNFKGTSAVIACSEQGLGRDGNRSEQRHWSRRRQPGVCGLALSAQSQGHARVAGKMCPQKAPAAHWSNGDQERLHPQSQGWALWEGLAPVGWERPSPAGAPLSSLSHRSGCPPYIRCWYPKKEKKKSQIMLSSRSLSPHLCRSPDKRNHYFKTPADIRVSLVMNPWAAAIAAAPLIGAPTVPAAGRLLFVSHEWFLLLQQLWFAGRHTCLHAFGSRWLQKARPGSFGRAMSSRTLPCVSSGGCGRQGLLVALWKPVQLATQALSSCLPATCSNMLHQVINSSLCYLHY